MSIGDDPLRRALRGINGASDALRAAQGLSAAGNLHERVMAGHRQMEELLRVRPTLVEDIARGQRSVAELFEKRPNILEEMTRQHAEFDRLVSGGVIDQAIGRLSAFKAAVGSAQRLDGVLAHQAAYERLIGGRVLVSDQLVDVLAARGSLTPLIERMSLPASEMGQRFAEQIDGLSRLVAEAAAAVPSRADLEARFPALVPPLRLPTPAEISAVDLGAASGLPDPGSAWLAATAAQIAAIDTPWVRDDRPDLSIAGFAALRGLTDIVGRTAPAAPRATQLVRAELGDYRREDPADAEVDDPMLASGLRFARGFDLRLASLPMALAACVFAPFGMVAGPAPEADPEELDAAIALMFRQLERKLRAFIDRAMRAGVGERWIRQRIHKDIREEWERRRQVDIDAGRTPGELFDYADFGEYRMIIEQGDNWRDVFQTIFRVKATIGETLGRLGTIRNPVAHVRPLSIEDLLILRVDGRRLYVWMGEIVP